MTIFPLTQDPVRTICFLLQGPQRLRIRVPGLLSDTTSQEFSDKTEVWEDF